ncbi:beta-phosphoglucomutase [Sphingobacterium tabacisoli]|uniref:Beta-phosphoglucomutase n=1 Tax=Sphingobacterium tabacisoli TaxID=2044855 RepID=A0ABW5L6M2_9SPHI|nr:beta-phosphoglucomutase [Sphingobacterium tabacisoli]
MKETKFEAYIFDLDGVLVDTAIYHYEAWKELADKLGIAITIAQNEKLKGISRIDSLKKILAWGNVTIESEKELKRLADIKNNIYVNRIEHINEEEVLPGALDFLKQAKAKHIKIALGSASRNAKLILQKTQLAQYFDYVVDGNMTQLSKPNPEVFQIAQKALGVTADKCIVFEDALAGIQAAKAANMRTVGISDNNTLLEEADLVFTDLTNITPAFLDKKLLANERLPNS